MFDNSYAKLKNILDDIGLIYTDNIFCNCNYNNIVFKNVKIPITKPLNVSIDRDHNLYRTWQVNQEFINNNDISKIKLSQEQIDIITNNSCIKEIYPNINEYI